MEPNNNNSASTIKRTVTYAPNSLNNSIHAPNNSTSHNSSSPQQRLNNRQPDPAFLKTLQTALQQVNTQVCSLKHDYEELVKCMDNHESRISAIERSLQQTAQPNSTSNRPSLTFRPPIFENDNTYNGSSPMNTAQDSSILIDVNPTPTSLDTPPSRQEVNAYGDRLNSIEVSLNSIAALVNGALGQAYNSSA